MKGYSYQIDEAKEAKVARALHKYLRISPKWAVEICSLLRGRKLASAKKLLSEVIAKNRAVPLHRYKKGVAHRHGLQKAYAGRYPVKAAKQILKALEGAEANAKYKGLDREKLFVKHIAAQRGYVIKGALPRAFGRASPFNEATTHVEIILEER